MVKSFALLLAVASTLLVTDVALARGRRGGCAGGNCYAGSYSGCPGGVCAVPAGPSKYAAQAPAAQAPVVATPAPAAPVAAVAPAPQPARYYVASNNSRRWFGRRR